MPSKRNPPLEHSHYDISLQHFRKDDLSTRTRTVTQKYNQMNLHALNHKPRRSHITTLALHFFFLPTRSMSDPRALMAAAAACRSWLPLQLWFLKQPQIQIPRPPNPKPEAVHGSSVISSCQSKSLSMQLSGPKKGGTGVQC